MHEQTIAQHIINDASKHGKVKSITIEVGDLAHLPADEMKLVLEKLTDWKVKILRKKATISCQCGYIGEPIIIEHLHDSSIYECPKCKMMLPDAIDGLDITLKEIEIDDEVENEIDAEEDEIEDELKEEE